MSTCLSSCIDANHKNHLYEQNRDSVSLQTWYPILRHCHFCFTAPRLSQVLRLKRNLFSSQQEHAKCQRNESNSSGTIHFTFFKVSLLQNHSFFTFWLKPWTVKVRERQLLKHIKWTLQQMMHFRLISFCHKPIIDLLLPF